MKLKTFGGLALVTEEGPAEGAGAQRRRLALLALLDWAGERGLTREKIVGLLWSESDPEKARRILNQAVYALRRDLGAEDLLLGTVDLRLNPERLWSDRSSFKDLLAQRRLEEAVALYAGPYLDGFYLPEAPEFERWVESERAALAHDYVDALERLAQQASDHGETRRAVTWWRKLANADPLNGRVALGLMRALADSGDAAGALQHARVYEELVRQELDAAPDPAVLELVTTLKSSPAPSPRRGAAPVEPPTFDTEPRLRAVERPGKPPPLIPTPKGHTGEYARPRPQPMPAEGRTTRPSSGEGTRQAAATLSRVRRVLAVAAITAAVLLGGIWFLSHRAPSAPAAPVIAVGRITDFTGDSTRPARALSEMLATNLARIEGLGVVSSARMYELMSQGASGADTAALVLAAARRAGATEVIDGALYRNGPVFRLDLRRIHLAQGSLRGSSVVRAEDLFALADSGTAALARAIGATGPTSPLADVSTKSLVAYRLYGEGVRAYFRGDNAAAQRLLGQALIEDSTFAMAAYWWANTQGIFNEPKRLRGLERAVRLASHATDRERLLIQAGWAGAADDPSRVAVAETLTVRYPNELGGFLLLGQARKWTGDFPGAVQPLRLVIGRDSLSITEDPTAPEAPIRCIACEAYAELIGVYAGMDSMAAAVRVAREWTRRQPRSAPAWANAAWTLLYAGRWTEALEAEQRWQVHDPRAYVDGFDAQLALRTGDFAKADSLFSRSYRLDPTVAEKWFSISARTQGRPHAALEAARRMRAMDSSPPRRGAAPYVALFEAQSWFDLGDPRRAAALFDSISRAPFDTLQSLVARHKAWTTTLAATAMAAAGDTARLAVLADSVEYWGQRSGYGRDRVLHHHIRGLLLETRGRLEAAALEYERAVFSPTMGFTRTNLQLGRLLLRLDRPLEAARWADAGRHGPLEASNTYVTYTELAELGALAWDAAGVADSAVARYRVVLNNWKAAEPAFSTRVERVRLRLAQLGGAP